MVKTTNNLFIDRLAHVAPPGKATHTLLHTHTHTHTHTHSLTHTHPHTHTHTHSDYYTGIDYPSPRSSLGRKEVRKE